MSMKVTRHEFVYGLDCDQATEEITRLRQLKQDGTRWYDLFSTPERAARVIVRMCDMTDGDFCDVCPSNRSVCRCGDYDTLLEWLKGERCIHHG